MKQDELSVFPAGGKNEAFADYFTGQSYLNMLTTEGVAIGNVTFEPGCCNHWHIHHAKKGGGQASGCGRRGGGCAPVAGRAWLLRRADEAVWRKRGERMPGGNRTLGKLSDEAYQALQPKTKPDMKDFR